MWSSLLRDSLLGCCEGCCQGCCQGYSETVAEDVGNVAAVKGKMHAQLSVALVVRIGVVALCGSACRFSVSFWIGGKVLGSIEFHRFF